ncbi:hypothetical protein GJU94_01260 [Brucella sp. 10RB9214]|nr:hypothetical protein [Brucella sp. 10RB9214]
MAKSFRHRQKKYFPKTTFIKENSTTLFLNNITASTHSINGSTGESLQANTARYIYTKQNGDTLTSPKYSFFAFSGVQ